MPSSSDSSRHLAANLKQLRNARRLTQQQLAKMSGVPRATWANLESGSANPTLAVLTRVAATLQVSIEELISPPRTHSRRYRDAELPQRTRGRGCEQVERGDRGRSAGRTFLRWP